jgi:hypothetical protein
MRVMVTVMRVASNAEGGEQATAMRAMLAATTVVGKDEGDGDGNEGGRRQRG